MVGARVDLETKQQLEAIAQRLGSTPSSIIATLIADYLGQERVNPTVNDSELLQAALLALQTQLAEAATQAQVALLSQQLEVVQSSLQYLLAALAKPQQAIQSLPVQTQVDSKDLLRDWQPLSLKRFPQILKLRSRAANRPHHLQVPPSSTYHERADDSFAAVPAKADSGDQSSAILPTSPSQDRSLPTLKTKTERVKHLKNVMAEEFCYDLKQIAVRFSLNETHWAEWESSLSQADFINKLEQRTRVAWCAVGKSLPGLYYQDWSFFN